jgi:hypothetical protein
LEAAAILFLTLDYLSPQKPRNSEDHRSGLKRLNIALLFGEESWENSLFTQGGWGNFSTPD